MTPVSVDEKIERERPKNRTAKELLTGMIMRDADEKYRNLLLEFVDTDTLADRLRERNSVATDFLSIHYGWCSIRFCAMDRVEGKPVENVVFTVQNIDQERKEQEAVIRRIKKVESISEAQSSFMDHISDDLQKPLQSLVDLNGHILRESGDGPVKGYARSAYSGASRLLMLTDGLVDGFALKAGKKQLARRDYSLRQLLIDALQSILPLAEENRLSVALDIAEALPDGLRGDPRVLREVLVNLIVGIMPVSEGGKLQLAVYGKSLEDRVHLLFSVRTFSDAAQVSNGNMPAAAEENQLSGLSMEIVSALLNGMGSALKTVRSPAGRGEVYFEIEQPIVDPAPIGRLTVEDANA